MGMIASSMSGIGCPRCGCRIVVRETQFIGGKSKIMETCDKCENFWFDNTTFRKWETIAAKGEGKFLCIVTGLDEPMSICG